MLAKGSDAVVAPTPESFRALARSAPWRWQTLRFVARWQGLGFPSHHIRAWVQRPDRLRVETLHGQAILVANGDSDLLRPLSTSHLDRADVKYDETGLVVSRHPLARAFSDDILFGSYYWLALLDPLELADGGSGFERSPDIPAAAISDVKVVDHAGRLSWEALLTPTARYEPQWCNCCSLLFGPKSEYRQPQDIDAATLQRYPAWHRIRLDCATAICVLLEQVGGIHAGWGHFIEIETSDEPIPPELFGGESSQYP